MTMQILLTPKSIVHCAHVFSLVQSFIYAEVNSCLFIDLVSIKMYL